MESNVNHITGEVTITMSVTEFATFVDCTPGVYNKLPGNVQRTVGELRDTQAYHSAENRLVHAANNLFNF